MKIFLRLCIIGLAVVALSGCVEDGDGYTTPRSVSINQLHEGYAIVMDRHSGDSSLPERFCIEFDEGFDDLRYKLYNEENRSLEIEGRYRIRNGDIELEIDGDGDDLRDYIAVTSIYSGNDIVEGDYYDIIDESAGDSAEYRVKQVLSYSCYR
jgi:hypothetical protein